MFFKRSQSITVKKDDDGTVATIGTFEGVCKDVACYIAAGEHPTAEAVLQHGHKLTEKHARALGASWPANLRYRL